MAGVQKPHLTNTIWYRRYRCQVSETKRNETRSLLWRSVWQLNLVQVGCICVRPKLNLRARLGFTAALGAERVGALKHPKPSAKQVKKKSASRLSHHEAERHAWRERERERERGREREYVPWFWIGPIFPFKGLGTYFGLYLASVVAVSQPL